MKKLLLRAIGPPYRGVNRLRRALYRAGVLQPKRLPKPVISIGNLAAGGAGKTPAVIAIGRFLLDQGLRVAVLTRGYGREGMGGAVTELDAAKYGDEPVLIKKHLDKADVIVGGNRHQNGLTVTPDVYLLDDGFQHLQLHRDLDVVIDVEGAALYREGRSALRDADIVIPRRLRLDVPAEIRGKRLFAFAALANNEQFFDSLRAAGLTLAGTRGFRDHHRYLAEDIAAIQQAARDVNAERIVTTEKDAVKIADDAIIAIPAVFEIAPDVLARIVAAIR